MKKNTAILMLGSNVGDSVRHLQLAIESIEKKAGLVSQKSNIYKTAPWGFENQNDFLNQALVLETELSSEALLKSLLDIEQALGRIREQKNAPRTLDIDILFFNDEIIETKALIVPHPRLQERNFVLFPLMDLVPDFIHPVLDKTIRELKQICPDTLTVHKLS